MLPGSAARLAVSHGGCEPASELLPRSKADGDGTALGALTLSRGTLVRGYVKRCVTDKGGVFVVLDRHTDGRIKLSNLSDGFIEVPETSFPEGRLVTARVAAVSPEGRVELSLRSSVLPSGRGVSELQPGELVDGRVRRVEKYGVFVDILGTQVAGLAHISELSDAKVHDVSSLFM
ncbi:RNA binding rRNA processing protein, partial [Haematococcus lacustris]